MADHLVLVDGSGWMHRFFHGMPSTTNARTGEENGGITGFCNALWQLRRQEVSHLAVAFDMPGRTYRQTLFPAYKANRPPKKAGLQALIVKAIESVPAFSIATICSPGWEADDVMATAARAAAGVMPVTIYSNDKDMLQLVQPGITVVTRTSADGFKRYDEAEVVEKFGVRPQQIPEWLALAGDPGDNIPGVPGIGAKKAAQLLAEFGSISRMVLATHASTDRLTNVLKRVQEHGGAVSTYQQLTRLRTINPDFDLSVCLRRELNLFRLAAFLREIDHPGLLREIRETAARAA